MSNTDDITGDPAHERYDRTPTKRKVAVGVAVGAASMTGLAFITMLFPWPDSGRNTDIDTGVTDALPVAPEVGEQADVDTSTEGLELLESADDDRLSGEPASDVLQGGHGGNDVWLLDETQATNDVVLTGAGQEPADQDLFPSDPVQPSPATPGLTQLCPSVVHGELDSGIWVRGSVYGLEDGWIFIGGPTLNGGEPVQIPVSAGVFDSPLPITQYGDHPVTFFDLESDDLDVPVDLLPTLLDGPGAVFSVGPDEGPIYEQECIDFTQDGPADVDAADPGDPTEADPAVDAIDPAVFVEEFIDGFVQDHRTGDVDHLQATLHPTIRLAFGDDVCTEYVARTAGSIVGATIVSTDAVQPLEMNSPNGPISFPEAIPFTVEFMLLDGSTVVNDARLPIHDGQAHWLTTCGVDMP